MNSRILIGIIAIASILALTGCIQPAPANCNGHQLGDTFKDDQNCNTCTCTENGIACTAMACLDDSCDSASECETTGIPHDACAGEWQCINSKCNWNCNSAESQCISASDCEELGLVHIECVGEWNCQNNKCGWACMSSEIGNPAAVKCVEDGGTGKIITAEDGSQSGLCVFSDNSYCDDWAYFRGECSKGEKLLKCNEFPENPELCSCYDANSNEFLFTDECTQSNEDKEFTEKCLNENGIIKMQVIMDGQEKLCIFSDNSYCKKNEFIEGNCSKGQNQMKCVRIGTRSEGWADSVSNEFLYYENCATNE